MKINKTESSNFFEIFDNDKYLAVAYKNGRMESIGGVCKARDWKKRERRWN